MIGIDIIMIDWDPSEPPLMHLSVNNVIPAQILERSQGACYSHLYII